MFIRIYFDDKPLFLCDAVDGIVEPFVHHDDAVYIDELDSHTVKTMIHEMQQDHVHAGVFYHPDLEALKKAFFRRFTPITAAGGLVTNDAGEALLIFRRGKWDLPKGKLDEGETLEECAVREVKEETGLVDVALSSPLIVTYHTYHQGTKFMLKDSHWYRMSAPGSQPLTPQTEEDITKLKWVGRDDMEPYLAAAFSSVRDVLKTWLAE